MADGDDEIETLYFLLPGSSVWGLIILYTQRLLMERRAEDKELTTTPGADEHSGSDVVM